MGDYLNEPCGLLDHFNGVVIVTTNLSGNYDPALLQRIDRHIKCRRPDKAMRCRLRDQPAIHRVIRADYCALKL